jgi:hypothetical protein
MGYRSDVVIAFAFNCKEQIDEVMAVYRMDPRVQKLGLETAWTIHEHEHEDFVFLTYAVASVKWYESYEDVQGLQHMSALVKSFDDERGRGEGNLPLFPFAYRFVRIGEEDQDIESDSDHSDMGLMDQLWDRMSLIREINTDF